jgi:hypothetical protein
MAFSTVRRIPALLVILCGLASATDLKIVTRQHSGAGPQAAPPSVMTRYFHDSRSRTDSRNGAGRAAHPGDKPVYTWGPRQAFIQQCDARRSFMLNLDAREYTSAELDERGVPKGFKPAVIRHKEPGRGSVEIFIDSVDTGERKEMFGRAARHIVTHERRVASPDGCQQSMSSETDGWYIDLDVPSVSCHTAPRITPREGSTAISVLGSSSCLQKLEVHRTGVTETGFPVKLTTTTHTTLTQPDGSQKDYTNTFESEVTELSEAPLDPALFEVPAGFKLVSKLNTQPPVPTMVALQMWWERLKRSIRGRLG